MACHWYPKIIQIIRNPEQCSNYTTWDTMQKRKNTFSEESDIRSVDNLIHCPVNHLPSLFCIYISSNPNQKLLVNFPANTYIHIYMYVLYISIYILLFNTYHNTPYTNISHICIHIHTIHNTHTLHHTNTIYNTHTHYT